MLTLSENGSIFFITLWYYQSPVFMKTWNIDDKNEINSKYFPQTGEKILNKIKANRSEQCSKWQ